MKTKYEMIDFVKYICSILVIVIHTSPGLPYSEFGNFVMINIIGRIAVPFFFVASGYFMSKNLQLKGDIYFKKYMKSLIKVYLIWSLVYIPCGLLWIHQNLDIPLYMYPLALCIALFYIGTYFHLWYIPALIFSLAIIYWLEKRVAFRYILPITLILFSLGSIETYYGLIQQTPFLNIVDSYFNIFQTTRNGLFIGLCFVSWGFYLAKENRRLQISKHGMLTIICFIGMAIEAIMLYGSNNKDMNFLFMSIPFTICFFEYSLQCKLSWKLDFKKLREYSSYYYFSHAIFLVFIPELLKLVGKQHYYEMHGLFRFISVLLCTHIISVYLYRRKYHT